MTVRQIVGIAFVALLLSSVIVLSVVTDPRERERVGRWWAHFRAWTGGYFWLPCPHCGRRFGGQEHGGGQVITGVENRDGVTYTSGMITCPRCPGTYDES